MYKVVIEKVDGSLRIITTVETENIDLVYNLLEIPAKVSIDSDVPNRNIDPEWQALEQRIKALETHNKIHQIPKSPYDKTVWPYGLNTQITC